MIVGSLYNLESLILAMESPKRSEESAVLISDSKSKAKGKAALHAAEEPVGNTKAKGGGKKVLAIFDLIFRLAATGAASSAAYIMATSEERLPFFTQFLQFHVKYNRLPTFTYFVVTNAGATAYLALSLPISVVCMARPHVVRPRIFLLVFDTAMVAFIVSAASAATAITDLTHNGSVSMLWSPMCQQFSDFCQQTSSAVVASYVAGLLLVFLSVLLSFALRK